MPADATQLNIRLLAASEKDTVRGMFLTHALTLVRQKLGDDAAAACASKLGLRKWIDLLSYPAHEYLRLLWACVDALEPIEGSADAAFRALGRGAVDIFFSSPMGKTLLTLVGGNPRRLIANAPMAYRSAVSYGERVVNWRGDRAATVSFRNDLITVPYHEGVFEAGLLAMGAKTVQVRGVSAGVLDADYHVEWT